MFKLTNEQLIFDLFMPNKSHSVKTSYGFTVCYVPDYFLAEKLGLTNDI